MRKEANFLNPSRRQFLIISARAGVVASEILAGCAPSADSPAQRIIVPPELIVVYEDIEMTLPGRISKVGKEVPELSSYEMLPDTGEATVKVTFSRVRFTILPTPENQEEKLSKYAEWMKSKIQEELQEEGRRALESELLHNISGERVRFDYTTMGPNLPGQQHIRIDIPKEGDEFVKIDFQIPEGASEEMREKVNQSINSIRRA